MAPFIVCIDGNIGAGKSTLLKELERRGYTVFREEVHEWMWALTNCYSDSNRWACTLQIAALTSMANQKRTIDELSDKLVLVERCPISTMAFTDTWYAKGCLSSEELTLVRDVYDLITWSPNVTVMLATSPIECYERMNARGRKCEEALPLSHLVEVKTQYDRLYADGQNVISVDSLEPVAELADKVETILNGLSV